MKQILCVLVIAGFIACNADCTCKMQQANVDVVQAMYDGFAEGNIDTVLALMAEDIEWNEAENFIYADLNPYKGPQNVAEGLFARLGGEWEYFKLTGMSVKPVGESGVLGTGRYQAKHKASGKELDAQFAHVWEVNDGKATSFQQYTDTKQAAEVVMVDEPEEEMEEATEDME